jgi:hypothetical protein
MPRFLLTPSGRLAKFSSFSSPHQSGSSQCMFSSLQKSSFPATRIKSTREIRSYSASAKLSADSVSNSNDKRIFSRLRNIFEAGLDVIVGHYN